MRLLIYLDGPFLSIFLKLILKRVIAVRADVISLIGSARNTPFTPRIDDRINTRGISRITFLSSAKNSDSFVCPSPKKVCWHAI